MKMLLLVAVLFAAGCLEAETEKREFAPEEPSTIQVIESTQHTWPSGRYILEDGDGNRYLVIKSYQAVAVCPMPGEPNAKTD